MDIDTNALAEKVVEGVVGEIPEVGGFLSGLISVFWPTSKPDIWAQIKGQTEALIQQDIAANKYLEMERTLQGIRSDMNEYSLLTDQGQRREKLEAMDNSITLLAPQFLSGDPGHNFSLFWGMALVHLSVRAERAAIYNDDPNRQLLQELAQAYAAFAVTGTKTMYNQRMPLIGIDLHSGPLGGFNPIKKLSLTWYFEYWVKDNLTGEVLGHQYVKYNRFQGRRAIEREQNIYFSNAWQGKSEIVLNDINDKFGRHIATLQQRYPIDTAGANNLLKGMMIPADFEKYISTYLPQAAVLATPPVIYPFPNHW
jgi:hypothetical protein